LVVINLARGTKDIILRPADAERFASELERFANHCQQWLDSGGRKSIFLNQQFEIERIQSWDGNVNVKFDRVIGPLIPMPISVAREVAHQVRLKVEEAKYGFSINLNPVATTGG
jgi:hypothetical protein